MAPASIANAPIIETIAIVHEVFAEDFRILGYSSDPLKPMPLKWYAEQEEEKSKKTKKEGPRS